MVILSRKKAVLACRCLGLALLYMPNDLSWYWGNLVVYVNSYIYFHNPNSNSQAPWLISAFVTSWGIALMIGAYLNRKLSCFQVTTIGVIIYDLGLFAGYLSIKQSMYLLDFTMGTICGLGYGLIQGMVFLWVRDMTTKNTALAYGLISNCLNLGAMFLNQLATLYINPDNLETKMKVGMSKIFIEKSIVERVPSFFLILASVVFALHFVGMVLIRLSERRDDNVNICDENSKQGCKEPILQENTKKLRSYTDQNIVPESIAPYSKENGKKNQNGGLSASHSYQGDTTFGSKLEEKQNIVADVKNVQISQETKINSDSMNHQVYDLKMALKTSTFYVLCFTLMSGDLCYLTVLNFYKTFGGLWIHNDHFLMGIGTATSFVVLVMRLVWGLYIDRFGIKNSTIIFIACISMFFFTYQISPMVSPWAFACWTIALSTLCTALYIIFPVAVLKLFGPVYFSSIYGAVMSTTIFTNIIAPMLLEMVLLHFGWYTLFTAIGFLNFLVLISALCWLPA